MRDYISSSIRRKLTFVMLGTAVVALLVTATAMIIYEARTYHQTWVDDLVTQAEIIGKTSAPALSFDDAKAARENLSVLRLRPLVTAAAIYTADGKLFADYVTTTQVPVALPVNAERNGYRIEGNQLSVFQEVRENGQFLGTVYLRAGYELWNRLLGYLAIVGLSILASLAVTLAVSAWLQRAITEPVLGVARVAQQVMERRDYKLRVRKTSSDEVGVLVDAFNDMLAEADRRATALETANADLLHEMRERHAAEDALKLADQRKDEFLATLAHELRNPLAPLRNGLQIMRMTNDACRDLTCPADDGAAVATDGASGRRPARRFSDYDRQAGAADRAGIAAGSDDDGDRRRPPADRREAADAYGRASYGHWLSSTPTRRGCRRFFPTS